MYQSSKDNPTIAVHVLSYDASTKSFIVVYLSPETDRQHVITLLLLDSDDGQPRRHYVWVKNLSALICHRSKVERKQHVCISCLQVFSRADVLEQHRRYCLMHAPQQVVYPDANDPRSCKLSFSSHFQEFAFPDLFGGRLRKFSDALGSSVECNGDGDDGADTSKQFRGNERIIDVHRLSGFCVHRVSVSKNFRRNRIPTAAKIQSTSSTSTCRPSRESSATYSHATYRCTRSRRASKRRTKRQSHVTIASASLRQTTSRRVTIVT